MDSRTNILQFRDKANDSSVFPITLQKAVMDNDSSVAQDLTYYISEYNISAHKTNTWQDSTINPCWGTRAFRLSDAISLTPDEYKKGGLKLTFITRNGDYETYVLNYSEWSTDEAHWKRVESQIMYFECSTSGSSATKTVGDSSTGYIPYPGGSFKIKFSDKNTAIQYISLKVGASVPKPLYYNEQPVTQNNTWEDNETVDVYYDGTNYNASPIYQKFESGEHIDRVKIDNSLTDYYTNGVLSSQQGVLLNSKIGKMNFEEVKATITQSDGYIDSSGNVVDYASTANGEITIPDGYTRIRFLGINAGESPVEAKNFCYCFYDSNDDVVGSSVEYDYDPNIQISSQKEYIIDVPTDAVKFKWSISDINKNDVYAYIMKGKTIMDMIEELYGLYNAIQPR